MEKVLSNFLKKLEQLKEAQHFIVGNRGNKDLYKLTYMFIEKIIPDRVIMNRNAYEITHIDKRYHLDGFQVTTENDRVQFVRVFGYHPNNDPDIDLFCLPDFKKGVYFTTEYLTMIIANIKTYYLDNCFFDPTGKMLRYKKMKSMYVQLNK